MSMNYYGPETFEYTLQPDDTLWDLADEYNTSAEEIMAANVDLDPNNMYNGQVIYLPVDSEVDASQRPEFRPGRRPPVRRVRPPFREFRGCPRGRFYTVQPGDTLYNIGFRFGISPREIVAVNRFIDFRFPLQIGDVICLPFR